MPSKKIFGIVLAGGEGKRLMPLTEDRAKPAVPFGGVYRLIDFALSNLLNSYVASVPAQQRLGKQWFLGSADAIWQSLNLIGDEQPDVVVVVGADHVYRMDFSQMIDAHIASGRNATVAAIRQPIELASSFGVIDVDPGDPTRIREFLEKPSNPVGLPDSPGEVLASMGNYVFNADALVEALRADADHEGSKHDMGGDIVPAFVRADDAGVYDLNRNTVPGATDRDRFYWRDVGTIDSFFEAHMDLVSALPIFNLYNRSWPIYTQQLNSPPAKFNRDGWGNNTAVHDSIVSPGSLFSGARIVNSVLGPWAAVESGADLFEAIVFDRVRIGRGAVVHRTILDKNVVVEDGARIGVERERDLERGLTVTDSGIVVVGKGQRVSP